MVELIVTTRIFVSAVYACGVSSSGHPGYRQTRTRRTRTLDLKTAILYQHIHRFCSRPFIGYHARVLLAKLLRKYLVACSIFNDNRCRRASACGIYNSVI